ncbi:hypothetical protein Scep_027183 [Stephania cephalantha]|uniref:Long-chain-alcohol oxidase n=1 Tax=Stephania cephalantha TaxID=152367 RepID=A0AAP0HRA8_9MAGN
MSRQLNYNKEEVVVEVREGEGEGEGEGRQLGVAAGMQQLVAYENTLSARQMDSLNALCDTIWPSLSPPTHNHHHHHLTMLDHSLLTYYTTSASMAATPQRLGGLISQRLQHPALFLLRLALWLLSTWFGTFILCGVLSVSTEFPYLHSFSKVSQKKREKIIRGWSCSSLYLLRMLFQSFKMLVLLVFFTQKLLIFLMPKLKWGGLNDRYENPAWKAIGYPGPDPDFPNSSKTPPKNSGDDDEDQQGMGMGMGMEEAILGPLCRGIVDLTHSKHTVATTLRKHGFDFVSHDRQKSSIISCDVVVVGSGSGGGVAAGILAKAGYKVLVLEKGDYFARSALSLLEGPAMDQMYEGSGFMATADLGVTILAGSTVGGGSTVNWSASIKTPKHVRKEWCEEEELELFGSGMYEEAMEAVCDRMGVQSEAVEEGFNNCVLRRGCVELGYPVTNIPRNAPADHYCGWCCFGCKDGRKQGTAETWLVDAVDSGNALILPNCKALKVLYSQGRGGRRTNKKREAIGVVFEHEVDNKKKKKKQLYVVKSRVTVVAAGALETPALLKRSGEAPEVAPGGNGLGYFPDEEKKKSFEGGIMTAMSTVVGEFEGSGYGAVIQTPALHPGMFSALTPWVSAEEMRERMRRFSRTAHVFALARDEGEGGRR